MVDVEITNAKKSECDVFANKRYWAQMIRYIAMERLDTSCRPNILPNSFDSGSSYLL
jgi:hypothetical protein